MDLNFVLANSPVKNIQIAIYTLAKILLLGDTKQQIYSKPKFLCLIEPCSY